MKRRGFIINNVLIFKLLTFFAPVLLKDIASFIIIHFVLKFFSALSDNVFTSIEHISGKTLISTVKLLERT